MEKNEQYYLDLIKEIKYDRMKLYERTLEYPNPIIGNGSFEVMERQCEQMEYSSDAEKDAFRVGWASCIWSQGVVTSHRKGSSK